MKKTLQLIIGPNGCGKSQELNYLINGEIGKLNYLTPHFFSHGVSGGYLKQSSLSLYFSKRVYSNLVTPFLLNQSTSKNVNSYNKIYEFLEFFDLGYLLNLNIDGLSGGELKIIRLLAELLLNRTYFIMDDPYSSLDLTRINSLNSILNNVLINRIPELSNLKHLIISTVNSQRKHIPPSARSLSNKIEIIIGEDITIKERWIEFITFGLFIVERNSIGSILISDALFEIKEQKRKLLGSSTCIFEARMLNVIHCPNGSGKTLLLNLLIGYFPKQCEILSGKISFQNDSSEFSFKEWIYSKKYRIIRNQIIYVPQNSEFLLACYSPRNLIEKIFFDFGYDKELSRIIPFINDLFDERQMNERSTGEIRFYSVFFACLIALLNKDIRLVILDEPDSYLDMKFHNLLILLFSKLLESNILIVITSHNHNIYDRMPHKIINFN